LLFLYLFVVDILSYTSACYECEISSLRFLTNRPLLDTNKHCSANLLTKAISLGFDSSHTELIMLVSFTALSHVLTYFLFAFVRFLCCALYLLLRIISPASLLISGYIQIVNGVEVTIGNFVPEVGEILSSAMHAFREEVPV